MSRLDIVLDANEATFYKKLQNLTTYYPIIDCNRQISRSFNVQPN